MTPDRCVPGKRLRNWHRRYARSMPLRAFVRDLAAGRGVPGADLGTEAPRVAKAWLAGKGARS